MESNNEFSLPSAAETKIIRLQLTSADSSPNDTIPVLTEEASGLVLLRKEELEGILSSLESTNTRLKEALQHADNLQKEYNALLSTPSRSNTSNEGLVQALLEQSKERQNMYEKLEATQVKLQKSQEKVEELQTELTAFNYDWDNLLADHKKIQPLAKLSNRYKNYFTQKLSEVYHAQAQLREPALRPKPPPGCLNCGGRGHPHYTCPKEYNGKFCQECNCTDFSTRECPWPHFANAEPSLPEHLKCRRCRSPRNMPDPHCSLCRKQLVEKAITMRRKVALEIEADYNHQPFVATNIRPSGLSQTRSARPPGPSGLNTIRPLGPTVEIVSTTGSSSEDDMESVSTQLNHLVMSNQSNVKEKEETETAPTGASKEESSSPPNL
ncbi:uncharacterized protein LOC122503610 [Leptopilina heterotoma]|uniref:uncharacterized protein LOC122497718 n=1 Tax=Leptopilina heterotoma TaxID=63436 RepID=UPI001CA7BC79|nr:uncharacterized protein LOC122497718 [Leptopilina heterotoma]XP_043470143.1 uncharacterized protein LOC122503610 [Leptopilina heterotoma]